MNDFEKIYRKLHSETDFLEKGILDKIKKFGTATANIATGAARTAGSAVGIAPGNTEYEARKKYGTAQQDISDLSSKIKKQTKDIKNLRTALTAQGVNHKTDQNYLNMKNDLGQLKNKQTDAKNDATTSATTIQNERQMRALRMKGSALAATHIGNISTQASSALIPATLSTERPGNMAPDSTAPQQLRMSRGPDFDRLYKKMRYDTQSLRHHDEELLKFLGAAPLLAAGRALGTAALRSAVVSGARAGIARVAGTAAARAAGTATARAAGTAAADAAGSMAARTAGTAAADAAASSATRASGSTAARNAGTSAGKRVATATGRANGGWGDLIDTAGSLIPYNDSQTTQSAPSDLPEGRPDLPEDRQKRNYTEPD